MDKYFGYYIHYPSYLSIGCRFRLAAVISGLFLTNEVSSRRFLPQLRQRETNEIGAQISLGKLRRPPTAKGIGQISRGSTNSPATGRPERAANRTTGRRASEGGPRRRGLCYIHPSMRHPVQSADSRKDSTTDSTTASMSDSMKNLDRNRHSHAPVLSFLLSIFGSDEVESDRQHGKYRSNGMGVSNIVSAK